MVSRVQADGKPTLSYPNAAERLSNSCGSVVLMCLVGPNYQAFGSGMRCEGVSRKQKRPRYLS